MKTKYTSPTMDVIGVAVENLICTSGGTDDGQWGQLVPGNRGEGKIETW